MEQQVPIDSRPDHVAIAVPDHAAALTRWEDELGAGRYSSFHNPGRFDGVQVRYANGAKLELLAPSPDDDDPNSFLRGFLSRFGSRVHHVTLKVPDLAAAIDDMRAAGLDVVDVDLSEPQWQESFLRPSQIGGLVVQVASSDRSDQQWAEETGDPPKPATSDVALIGPLLMHDDLDRAEEIWTELGATVAREQDAVLARWADAPLEVKVLRGPKPDALGLRFRGTGEQPADPKLGPAIVRA